MIPPVPLHRGKIGEDKGAGSLVPDPPGERERLLEEGSRTVSITLLLGLLSPQAHEREGNSMLVP